MVLWGRLCLLLECSTPVFLTALISCGFRTLLCKTPQLQKKCGLMDFWKSPCLHTDLCNQEWKLDCHQLYLIGCHDTHHVSLGRWLCCEETPFVSYCTCLTCALARPVLLEQTCGRGFEFFLHFLKHAASAKTVSVVTPPIVAYNIVPDQKQRRSLSNFTYPQVSVASWYSCNTCRCQMIS